MIFIIGGSYQGKTDCAFRRVEEKCKNPVVFDGKALAKRGRDSDRVEDILREISYSQVVLHLDLIVRKLMEWGVDIDEVEEQLIEACMGTEEKNWETVITADEIGYGIVPLDAFEREYREKEGRICQKIAARAREVWRVVCGLEMKMKG